jgi:hypothetical protein
VAAVAEEEARVNDSGGVGGGRCRRQQWHRRRPTSTVAVATDRVDSSRDLESVGMKRETRWSGLLFIRSKMLAAVLN